MGEKLVGLASGNSDPLSSPLSIYHTVAVPLLTPLSVLQAYKSNPPDPLLPFLIDIARAVLGVVPTS